MLKLCFCAALAGATLIAAPALFAQRGGGGHSASGGGFGGGHAGFSGGGAASSHFSGSGSSGSHFSAGGPAQSSRSSASPYAGQYRPAGGPSRASQYALRPGQSGGLRPGRGPVQGPGQRRNLIARTQPNYSRQPNSRQPRPPYGPGNNYGHRRDRNGGPILSAGFYGPYLYGGYPYLGDYGSYTDGGGGSGVQENSGANIQNPDGQDSEQAAAGTQDSSSTSQQNEAYAAAQAAAEQQEATQAAHAHPGPSLTLVFKDGRPQEQAANYMLTASAVYVTSNGSVQKIAVSDLDLTRMASVNSSAGIDFSLPVRQ